MDQVSIHTLVAAAYQIVVDVCKVRGIPREIEDSTILKDLGVKREVISAIRRPQNFFKHAETDHDQTVKLNPMLSACLLLAAIQYMLQLRLRPTPERDVFRTWFFLRLPERAPPEIKAFLKSLPIEIDPEDYGFFLEQIHLRRSRSGAGAA